MGICAALSQIVLTLGVTVLAQITLRGLSSVEKWLVEKQSLTFF